MKDLANIISKLRDDYINSYDTDELRIALKRANIYEEQIQWDKLDDTMSGDSFPEVQEFIDIEWNDYVSRSQAFHDLTDDEQIELKSHDLFLSTPINIWKIYESIREGE